MLQHGTYKKDIQEITLPTWWKSNENVKSNSVIVLRCNFSV